MKKRPAAATTVEAKRRAVAAPAPEPAAEKAPEPGPAFEFTRCHSFVPAQVRELYNQVLPIVFAVPKGKRHKFEERVASEAVAILAEVQEDVQKKMEETTAAKERAQNEQVTVESSVKEKELVVGALNEQVKSKRKALAEVALAYRSRREAVKEAKLAEQEGAQKVEQANSNRVELEAYLEQFKQLKAGTFESPEAEKKLQESLPVMLERFSLTQSLVQAGPLALSKAPAARGDFDATIVNHIEEALLAGLSSYEGTIKDAEPTATALLEKTKVAEAALAQASEQQVDAASKMTEARNALAAESEAMAELRRSYQALGKNMVELGKTFEGLSAELEQVQEDRHDLVSKVAAEAPETEGDLATSQRDEAAKGPEPATLGGEMVAEDEAGALAAAENVGV